MRAFDLIPRVDTVTHATELEAIAGAMLELEPGDTVTVHDPSCAERRNQDCDCRPRVVLVPEPARA